MSSSFFRKVNLVVELSEASKSSSGLQQKAFAYACILDTQDILRSAKLFGFFWEASKDAESFRASRVVAMLGEHAIEMRLIEV